jgi:predicted ATPase/class 3 adenylate cyclase
VGAPTGTVTFLFTDIEGSTRLWEAAPDAMGPALASHDQILRTAVEAYGGYIFAPGGDGFAAAFRRAGDAIGAALDAQAALGSVTWPEGAPVRVRMGLHTGVAEERDGNYFGPAVNRAARLMAVAHGGQVLCSGATAALVEDEALLIDLCEHRLRDLDRPVRVFQLGEGVFPPLRSLDAVPTNLPTVRTELLGRSEDVTALSELVGRERLVTLTGTGGVGKTRLALAAAAVLAPGFADGCWLVELAPVAEGAEVAKVVASALGVPAADGDGLAKYLSDRRALVVLDNCEHLRAEAADLVDAVLAAAGDVHVLATSREPLSVEGERVYRVGSLALPSPGAAVDEAARAPAVQLFAERAAAARRRFALDSGNVAAVIEICRRLDGIPLAIELAAATAAAMSPALIAARLGERFRLLGGGSRRALDRQRTLLATVAWSHELLSDDEKAVFRRLSVFPASFDIAAAEAVAGGDEPLDVLGAVVRLVACSLVQFDEDEERYRLLETLRQYGADRLVEAGETDHARQRHAHQFLALAERVAPELNDARYPDATILLTTELENLRAVAQWCIEGQQWGPLATLAEQLWLFLYQAAPVDGAHWYGEVADHAQGLGPQLLADILAKLAVLAGNSGADYPHAALLAERSLGVTDAVEESPWAWLALASVAFFTTRGPEGLRACERALAAAEARHNEFVAIIALGVRANLARDLGDAQQHALDLSESLRRAERGEHPLHARVAAIGAASSHLWTGAGPDPVASLDVLARYDTGPRIDDTLGLWLDLYWGASLVGLHRPGAVGHLTRAVQLADRQAAPAAADLALRLLATAAAEAGYKPEAATLIGYCDAYLLQYRIAASGYAWVQAYVDDALAGLPDRAAHEARGAASTRGQLMTLVNHLGSMIEQPGP